MPQSIAQRIVRLYPAIPTAAICIAWIAGIYLLTSMPPPLVRGLLMTPLFVVMGLWCWAVFAACDQKASISRGLVATVTFLTPSVLVFMAGVFNWPTHNSPAAVSILGLFVLGLWFAARALECGENPAGQPSLAGTGALILMMYFTIPAFWILRPRILRVVGEIS